MRMIPSVLISNNRSAAEARVFQAFKSVSASEKATCYHSLRLSEHEYKREGEIDFLLLSPQGFFVFEVKGGGVSRDANGIWLFRDRFGNQHRRSEGPFDQARSAMYSLRGRLIERFGENEISKIPYGYGVIFPDCTFDMTTVEWPETIVLDHDRFYSTRGFEQYLAQLIHYWQTKSRVTAGVPAVLIEKIAQFLRPKFDRVPNLRQQALALDRVMESLTEEQYEKLDAAEDNDRILCSGGAGTGKTFLAIEIARRHAAEGNRVLLVCRSNVLSSYIKIRLEDFQVDVMAVEQLQARSSGNADTYDVLVVDEAQDLMAFDYLGILDRHLKGGLAGGRWRIFFDANNQSVIYRVFEQEALDYLRACGAVHLKLKRNCRNTHNIVLQTKLVTLADLGTPSAGTGPPVAYKYYNTEHNAAYLLQHEIERLLSADVNANDITILSPRPYDTSSLRLLPERYKRQIYQLTPASLRSPPSGKVAFSTVAEFKGLENQFIIITDLKKIDASDALSLGHLYVAMSRAKAELVLIMSFDMKSALGEMMAQNAERLADDIQER